MLEEKNFELSVDYIKYIHEYLFKDVYEFAGEFRNTSPKLDQQVSGQVSGQVSEQQKLVLNFCIEQKSTKEIMLHLGINSRRYIREKIIKPLVDEGRLDYTNKNHINASNQKYITVKNEETEK